MKKTLLIVLLLLLIPSVASPQSYTEIFENGWGQGLYNSKSFFIDLDNNGLLDLIVGTYHGQLIHYEQASPASIVFLLKLDALTGMDRGAQSAPYLLDLDHDGLMDMIVGNVSGRLIHYEQESSGSIGFTLITDSLSGILVGRYPAPTFTDLDNDGLWDLIIGDDTGVLHHYEQEAADADTFSLVSDKMSAIDVGSRSSPYLRTWTTTVCSTCLSAITPAHSFIMNRMPSDQAPLSSCHPILTASILAALPHPASRTWTAII